MVRELFSNSSKENFPEHNSQHTVTLFGLPITVNTDDNLGEGGNVWTAVQDLAAYLETEVKIDWIQKISISLCSSKKSDTVTSCITL